MQGFYYGRHGETRDLKDRVRSRPDTPLTDQGKLQMKRTGKLLVARGIKPSLIVCSALPRAIHSAKIVAGIVGYNQRRIQRDSLFNERDCGKAVGMTHEEIKERWPGGYDTVPGAETLRELQKRAAKAAAWLKRLEPEVVLVIAHGTLGRAMVREFEGRPYTDELANGRVSFGRGQVMRLYPLPITALI